MKLHQLSHHNQADSLITESAHKKQTKNATLIKPHFFQIDFLKNVFIISLSGQSLLSGGNELCTLS